MKWNSKRRGAKIHCKVKFLKQRTGLREVTPEGCDEDIKKRWHEYTELYKKDLHDPDNHNRVITHLEPDILECEVKWALGNITTKLVEVMEFQLSYSKSLKDDAVKVLHSICQQIWKTQQWPQDWKRSVFIPIPQKDCQRMLKLLHNCTHLTR